MSTRVCIYSTCICMYLCIHITQYGSTVYIGIAMVYPPYIRIFIFTFNLRLISLLMISR